MSDLLALVLLAAALVLVPSFLAFALFSLAKIDRRPDRPPPVAAVPRHTARRRPGARRDDATPPGHNRLNRR